MGNGQIVNAINSALGIGILPCHLHEHYYDKKIDLRKYDL